MKHLLTNPAFPDIVGDWAASKSARSEIIACANDNRDHGANDLADPLFVMMARREIAASRLW